jgi:hypothetical protein
VPTTRQREALTAICGGQGGGWPGEFANLIGELLGTNPAIEAALQNASG